MLNYNKIVLIKYLNVILVKSSKKDNQLNFLNL